MHDIMYNSNGSICFYFIDVEITTRAKNKFQNKVNLSHYMFTAVNHYGHIRIYDYGCETQYQ